MALKKNKPVIGKEVIKEPDEREIAQPVEEVENPISSSLPVNSDLKELGLKSGLDRLD